ncbi:MAG: GEVED domain-containing protein, partial [Sphingobacteriales bacterium]|nr:GEVED domain-containing protein [Sphingobacteriales bacterium]
MQTFTKNLQPAGFRTIRLLMTSITALIMLLASVNVKSQTTLIDPVGNGGFETGSTLVSNSWTANNSTVDGWFLGTAPTQFAGSRCAYISANAGTGWTYSQTSAIQHLYYDFTVPAGEPVLNLNFRWKAGGEGSGTSDWDNLKVFLGPVANIGLPIPNAAVSATYRISGTTANVNGWYNLSSASWNNSLVGALATPGVTYRLIFSWKSDISGIANPPAALDNISLISSAPAAFTATTNGGLWSSPATWVGGVVPGSGNDVTIPSGAIVTVDQTLVYNNLDISGTLQWGATSFALTASNININSGGRLLAYSTGGTGQGLTVSGNFTNNGYTNLALGSLTFNGSGSTLSGTGTFQGNGTDGIIRGLFFNSAGSNVINTSQNLITPFGIAHTAGSLNTNGKLKIDNTAQVYGLPLNLQVANAVVTNMGTLYNAQPVVFGASVVQYAPALVATLNTRYVSGGNVYLCTVAGSFTSAPTFTTTTPNNTSGPTLLYLGTVGQLGNPFQTTAVTVGTQYFYNGNLYTCVAAGTPSAAAPPTHITGTAVSGGATFLYVGTAAVASANWDATTQTVRSLNLTNAGNGYSSAPAIAFSVGVAGGTGSGAVATAVYLQQVAGTANSLIQKSGVATISGGLTINSDQGASVASVDPQAASGVGAISSTSGGVNYTVAPTVGFALPTSLNLITNPGSGYTAVPTITVTGGNLVTGTALTSSNFTITVNQGIVESVYLNASTTATYSTLPTLALTVSPGVTATLAFPAGCLPTATANIGTNRQITSYTITNPGYGYVAAPTVGIGTTSATANGGTFTTVAAAPTARIALYNLTLNFFAPAASAVANGDDASIPANRKLNNLTLAGNGNGLNLTSNLTIFGTSPLSLAASLSTPGNVIDLGGNNLQFTWNNFLGASPTFSTTVGGTNTYIKNGSMTLTGRGGASTFNYPFSARFDWFAGSTPTAVTTGSTVTKVTVTETAAPSGGAIGTRAYLVNTNAGGVQGTNPTVTMNFNAVDALTVPNQGDLYIGQSSALSGAWSPRSASSGTGAIGTTGTRTTATTAPGPLVPTGADYFAWILASLDSANVTVAPGACSVTSHLVSADVTTNSGTVSGVTITYNNNGTPTGPVAMTNTSGNTWQFTIPAATPNNRLVTWSITATTTTGLTKTWSGASYQDEPLTGASASMTASATAVCSGSPVILTGVVTVPNVTKTVGTGATTSANYPNPMYSNWANNKMQILYRATELQAAGLAAGPLTAASLNITANNTTARTNFTINMAQTSATVLTTTFLTPTFTQVYLDASYVPVLGANNFAFGTGGGSSSSFVWDGSSNIVIQMCWDILASTATISTTCTADNTTYASVVSYNRTSTTGTSVCGITVAGVSTYTVRPTLSFTGNGGIPVSNATWSDGTSTVATGNPATVNPLVNTTYSGTLTAAGCPLAAANTVSVTTTALPASPSGANSNQCGTGVPACFVTGTSNGNYRWYTVPTGGTAIPGETAAGLNTVNGGTNTYSISATTTFYVAIFDGTCESLRTPVVATVSAPDPIAASSNGPVCANSPLQLTATVTGGSNANNYAYTWTASPATGSGIPSSVSGGSGNISNPSTISITPTAGGTYVYTLSALDGTQGCATTATVSVAINAQPVIDSIRANPNVVCSGAPVTLNVYSAGIGNGPQTAPTGYCTSIFSNSTEDDIGQVTFASINNPAVRPTPQTGNAAANKVYTDFTGLTPATIIAGTTYPATIYQFHDGTDVTSNTCRIYFDFNRDGDFADAGEFFDIPKLSGGFYADFSGNVIIPVTAAAGVTRMRVILKEGTVTSPCDPAGTWGETEDYLVNIQSVVTQNPALTYAWDNGITATTPSASVNPTTTTTYQATVTNALGCTRTSTVAVTVNPIPANPSTTGSEQCGTVIPSASVSSNSGEPTPTFKWYTVPTGGTAVQTNVSTTYLSTVATTTTFYVSEITTFGCESGRTPVTITVSSPDPLTVTSSTGLSACVGETFTLSSSYTPDFNTFATFDLTATGGAGSGVTGTVALTPNATGSDPYSLTVTAPGTYVYTITANDPDKGCTSITTVTVTVNAVPLIDSVTTSIATVCSGSATTLKAYSSVISSGSNTAPSYTAPGTSSNTLGDEIRLVQFISINNPTGAGGTNGYLDYSSIPAPTVSAGSSYSLTVNVANGGTEFAAAWFDWNRNGVYEASEFYNIPMTLGTNWVGTISVSVPANAAAGLTGFRVRSKYNAALIATESSAAYTYGETEDYRVNVLGVVTQNPALTYTWNPGALNGATVSVNPSINTIYTVDVTNTFGCTSQGTITVNTFALPAAPTAPAVTRCGPGAVTLTATGTGGTLNWYNVATGGISLNSTGSYPTSVAGSTSFWVAETSANGCEGPRTEVVVTTTPAPVLTITPSGPTTFCIPGGSVGLVATGSGYVNFAWTATPSVGSGLSANNVASVTATPTVAGTITYTVTANDGVSGPSGCANSASVVVTANATPVLDSVRAVPPDICLGSSAVLNAYSAVVSAGPTGLPAVYCVPTSSGTSTLTGLTLGSINFTAASQVSPFYNIVAPTPTTTTTLNSGQTYPLSLTTDGASIVSVWIDYNRNGLYEASEWTQPWINATTGTVNITVPANATSGQTGLRVRTRLNGNTNGSGDACASFGSGGAYDFTVNILGVVTQNPAYTYTWNTVPPTTPQTGASITVVPTVTTSYTVSVSSAAGCSANNNATPLTVTVIPVGAAASALPSTICAGSPVVLSANATGGGPFTYQWDNGISQTTSSVTVNPTATTTYTVTVFDVCGNSTTSSVTVTVNALPIVTVTPATASFCTPGGTPVTLTASGATSYIWSNSGSLSAATGAVVNASPSTTTTYVVTGTDGNGCSATASAIVTANPAVQNLVATGATICNGSAGQLQASSLVSSTASSYVFSTATGASLDPMSGAAQVINSGNDDTPTGLAANIGFSFNFNGTAYTQYSVSPDGWILLGGATATSQYINGVTSTTNVPKIYPYWDDVATGLDGNVKTLVTGVAPNRIFKVQWFVTIPRDVVGAANATFQAWLYEGSDKIEYRYGSMGSGLMSASAGITAGSTNYQSITFSSNSSSNSVANDLNSDQPASGRLYSYQPLSATYVWNPGNLTGATVNVSPSSTQVYTVTATATGGCTATANATITVNPRPTAAISGGATYCSGAQVPTQLSIAVTGTGPWSGTLSNGQAFSGSISPILVNVPALPSTTSYTVSTLSDATGCTPIASDLTGTATVIINPLAATPTATVTQPTCAVATGTITVTAPLGAGNSYTLDGTTTITWPSVSFSAVAPGVHTISVSNSFGCFAPATASVTVNPQPFTPAAPVVTGLTNVCPFVGTPTTVTYTATAAGATSYNWVLPPNVTLVSGAGTSTITVTFAAGFTAQANKQIKVTASSICGTSAQTIYYLLAQFPSTPGVITGPTDACTLLGTTATYSVAPVVGASGYIWSAQAGTTIVPAGPGTLGNTVTITFPTTFTTSAVTVQVVNACGTSGTRSLTIVRNNPSVPSLISGPTNACAHIAPGGTPATYTVPAVAGITTYTWTVPAGAIGLTGQGTNTISFTYPVGFTTGTVSVRATNGCGTSGSRSLTIGVLQPATPGVIDVAVTTPCPNRVYTYSLPGLTANATSILWSVTGGTILTGNGTSSITVSYPSTAVNGSVSAQAVSNCGVSTIRTIAVRLAACVVEPPP